MVQLGHVGRVTAITFSANGQLIVTGDSAGDVTLWETSTTRILRRFSAHLKEILAIKLMADENQLVTVSLDGTARRWELATARGLQKLDLGSRTISQVEIPDGGGGDLIAFASDFGSTVRMWSFKARGQIAQYKGSSRVVRDFALSADGRFLALPFREKVQILEVASGQEVGSLVGPKANVVSIEFSPDGSRIVTRPADRTLRLWDAQSKQEIKKVENVSVVADTFAFSPDLAQVVLFSRRGGGNYLVIWNLISGEVKKSYVEDENTIHAVAFSRGGKMLAMGSPRRTSLFDAATLGSIGELKGEASPVNALAYSADQKWFATGSGDGIVHLWDAKLGKEVTQLQKHTQAITSLAFALGGNRLASASADGTAVIWNIETEKVEHVLAEGRAEINSVAFSLDGHLAITGGNDKIARVWDVQTGKIKKAFDPMFSAVLAVGFSRDGKVAVATSNDGDYVWEVETGRRVGVLEGHSSGIGSAAFSSDSLLVLTVSDGVARLWNRATSKVVKRFTYGEGIVSAVLSANGRQLLTAGDFTDHEARLWDVGTGKELTVFSGHTDRIRALAFSPDGKTIATAGDDGTARTWNAATGQPLRLLASGLPNKKPVSIESLAFSRDGKFLATSDGKTLSAWNLQQGSQVLTWLVPDKSSIEALLGFSQDGKRLLVISDSTLRYVEVTTGQENLAERISFTGFPLLLESATLSLDGRFLLVGGADKDLNDLAIIYEVANGAELRRASVESKSRDPAHWITSIALSNDGNYFFTGTVDQSARVYESASGKVVSDLASHNGGGAIAFAPDGKHVATGAGSFYSRVQLWDLGTQQVVSEFEELERRIDSLAFTPDGKFLLAGGDDGEIFLWEVDTGKRIRSFSGHSSRVTSVAFIEGTTRFLSTSADGTTRLWDIEQEQDICSLITFAEGAWTVVVPGGYFDTNSLESLRSLHWVMPDQMGHALPLEIFTRDYFRTSLFSNLMKGQVLGNMRPLEALNRAQPLVRVVAVRNEADPDLVSVTVAADEGEFLLDEGGVERRMRSGVYDLRLFRDGRIVGRWPVTSTAQTEVAADDIGVWRKENQIELGSGRKFSHTFQNIRLPRRPASEPVKFTAYAFNEDRVKSASALPLEVAPSSLPVKKRAYLITAGVSANQSGWDLDFASKSAEDLRPALGSQLSSAYDVVEISLLSSYESDTPKIALRQTTKQNIRAVFELLAGRPIPEKVRAEIPNAEKLRAATPDDLVLFYISSHGYADPQGNFYLVPYDTGKARGITEVVLNQCFTSADTSGTCQQAREFIRRSVSVSELAQWWEGIDAGEPVMILDSCYSAAAPGRGFRPGPLGDRGFGQLAYDKSMMILTATQSNRRAFATMRRGNGRSLLADAIISGLSDNSIKGLASSLKATEKRVPAQYRLLYSDDKQADVQIPVLLDFTGKR